MTRKLVISYSDVDREAALKVRAQLAAVGHDVWIDREGIRGAVHWTQAILDAIDGCEGLVLVWSDDAKKSEDVREEIRLARMFRKPIFPVLAHSMSRIPGLPEEIGTLQVIGSGELAANMAELKARLNDPIKSNIQYAELVKNAFIPKAHNPYFVGRVRELKALFVDTRGYRGGTKTGIPIAISGLPGIGKTHLALAFGYRFNLFFPDGVYWVDAQNGIVHELGRIGHKMRVKALRDEHPRDYAGRVREKLCQLPNGLVIFDNVTDFPEFREWYPQGTQSCSVILTSRMPPRGIPVKTMILTELDSESAYEMLIERRPDKEEIRVNQVQRDSLTEICKIIGNHPLALELCASRLQSDFLMPSDYLQIIQPDPLGRLADENMNDVPLGAGAASLWKIFRNSYASLDEKLVDPYFLLMCCFAPQVINHKLIVRAYGKPDEGVKALDQLANVSFIRREQSNTFSLHPLVAQFARSLLKDKDFDYSGKFVEVMLGFLQEHEDNLASDVVRREKLHIDEALRVADARSLWRACLDLYEYKADIEDGLQEQIKTLENAYLTIEKYLPEQKRRLPGLRLRLGKAHRAAGRVREALDDFNWAESLYRGIKDVDPAEAASLRFELGDTYLALGRYTEAEKILSDALRKAKARLDNTAPEILQLRQALARHALYLGNYDKAGADFAKILEDRKNFYAAHPDTTSASGLASVHMDLSRLELARAHYPDAMQAANAALAIIKDSKVNESEYSQVYLLVGDIQYESGAYDQAEEQLKKARQDFRLTFGERHPNYGRALKALGEVHRKQGKFEEAEKEVKQAIAIFISVYGDSHPSVSEALAVQAKIYDHLCEFDKEQAVWEQVLDIQHKAYSEEKNFEHHPALAATHYDYASLFLRKGEYVQAADHLTKSLTITENSLGKNHVEYFGRLVRLATCFYEQQEYSRAEKTLDDADKLKDVIFKELHPYIARMLQLQSEILRRRGRFKDALAVIDRAIAMKETIYGTEEHPSVAEALEVKVKILHHLGEKVEAKQLIDRTLAIRRKAYGENHPDVSRSIHDLGSYYLRLGQYKEAIKQFEQARQITAAVFGRKHPDYVERTLNLANARNEQGEYRQALELLEEVEDVLPAGNHYLTARWLQLMGELQRRIGQFGAAMKSINQAIAMKKAIYGTDFHPSVAEALEIQGKIYDHLCEFDKEQAVWERILKIHSAFYSEQHPALANAHYDYSSLFLRKGEYDKAAEHVQLSLQITEHNFGKTHADYFGSLVRLAICRYEQQEYSPAQQILNSAKRLRPSIFGDSPDAYIARMLQLQSEILRRQGSFADALEAIDQAIAMKETIYGTEEHPSVAEALEVKVKILHHLGEKVEAKQLIDRTLAIRRKAYGENHPDVSRSIHDLGSYYLRLGQYKEAIEQFEQARQITAAVFGRKHPDYVERTLNLANARNEQGEYRQALELLEEVKDVDPTWNRLLAARRLQLMGELQRRIGQFGAAMKSINQAIELKIAIYRTEDHPSVAEALEIQGKIYDHLCEFDKEQAVWEQVLDIQNRFYSEQHPALAATHYDYASLFLRKGEYAPAVDHLTKSIAITKKSLGENHVEYFGRLVRLATCFYEQQQYSRAQTALDDAGHLQEAIFKGSSHPYIARMLQLQSEVLRDLARFDDALAVIDRAIAMKETIYGTEEHPSVAEALEAKADLLLSQFDVAESSHILDTIEHIRRKAYGVGHPQYANYQMRRARWYEIKGLYDEARNTLEQSLQTCLNVFLAEHPETLKRQVMLARIARITNNLVLAESRINRVCYTLGSKLETEDNQIVAETYHERSSIRRVQGDYDDALAELENALRIETRIFGSESPKVIELQNEKIKLLILFHRFSEADDIIGSALQNVEHDQPIFRRLKSNLLEQRAILLVYKQEYNQAIESVEEAIKLKKRLLGDEHIELARLYVEKAVVLRHQCKYKEALANLEAAHNIDNLHFNENHVFFARILLEQGRTYMDEGSFLAAQEYLNEALQIYTIQPNRNIKQHAEAAEALGRIYLESGRPRDALTKFEEARSIRTALYGSSHPEIAETLYFQARALLGISETDEKEALKTEARQKLEQALNMLRQCDNDNSGLMSEIDRTLVNL